MDIAISLNNVFVAYSESLLSSSKKTYALKELSFDLYKGETLGVVGRNGAGKSTFLKLMSGIISPDSGAITRNAKHIMMLSLQAGFLDYLDGKENSILNGMLLGATKVEMQQRIPAIREYSGLGEKFDKPISTYSTGMIARLGFAIAMQVVPDVMMVDEVIGVGDAEFWAKSNKLLSDLIRSDKTVVLTSHSSETIRQLCDRVLWLRNGEMVDIGAPSEIVDRYERDCLA